MPCKLERNGVNINCILTDEFLSLNTGALASLMKKNGDEEEMEHLLEGLLNVTPQLPITEEKMDIFLTTLRSIIPDINIISKVSIDIDRDQFELDQTVYDTNTFENYNTSKILYKKYFRLDSDGESIQMQLF